MPELARFQHGYSAPSFKRWLIVLAASVCVHWAVLQWAGGNLVFPLQSAPSDTLVTAQLHDLSAKKLALESGESPRKKAQAHAKPRRASAPQESPRVQPAPTVVAESAATSQLSDAVQKGLPAADSDPNSQALPPLAEGGDMKQDDAVNRSLHLPPSAELKYDVHARKKGLSYYGTGIINWQSNGSRYLITGKAKAAFFTVLEFKSEGEIDDAGIAPVLYAERAGNRSETNTHFHRERNTISFSASSMSYPRVGGEQDRASIIWQLAALGRSNPELFKPGEELYIFVAGVRNAAPWRIYILGEEEVELDGAPVKSWHVKSVPQQGGYEKTFDIWYASGYEWYPVKLRQTEVSGDYLELSLSNLVLAQQ